MKKLIFTFATIVMATNSFGQMTFGPRVGLNMTTMDVRDKDDVYSDDYNMKFGFHLGGQFGYEVTDMISLNMGLLYSTRGFKSESTFSDSYTILGTTYTTTSTSKTNMSLNYLDIPVTLNFGFDLGDSRLYVGVGPYFGIGLSGKWNWESETVQTVGTSSQTNSDSGTENIEWGSDETQDDLKRFELGFVPVLGLQFGSFDISASYRYGLNNIIPVPDDNTTEFRGAHRVIGVTVGFNFGN